MQFSVLCAGSARPAQRVPCIGPMDLRDRDLKAREVALQSLEDPSVARFARDPICAAVGVVDVWRGV